jgi:outer membrane protein TolC
MRAVREQFSFNRGSLLDLITVQEGLYQAGRDLIDASADRILVRYRLLHLTAQLDKMFDLGTLVSMNAKD